MHVKQVKHVIAALCRLLAAAGLDPVPPPDSFRRAKFGDAVQVSQEHVTGRFIRYTWSTARLHKYLISQSQDST